MKKVIRAIGLATHKDLAVVRTFDNDWDSITPTQKLFKDDWGIEWLLVYNNLKCSKKTVKVKRDRIAKVFAKDGYTIVSTKDFQVEVDTI